jgi:hypothetical protein
MGDVLKRLGKLAAKSLVNPSRQDAQDDETNKVSKGGRHAQSRRSLVWERWRAWRTDNYARFTLAPCAVYKTMEEELDALQRFQAVATVWNWLVRLATCSAETGTELVECIFQR